MKPVARLILKAVVMAWSAPNTLAGLSLLVLFGRGARIAWVDGALEAWGGGLRSMFERFSPIGATAMTLGHVVLGTDQTILALARDHERVHVRQAERWGPFFLPAYLGLSFFLWMRGKDAYRQNPFEVAAYGETVIRRAETIKAGELPRGRSALGLRMAMLGVFLLAALTLVMASLRQMEQDAQ
ncbi:MAG: hypothetical protein ACKO9Z_11070 [Planctomycetota bacterium]